MAGLPGRVALVTGGTAGIGFGVARALLRAGASVAVAGRSRMRGEAALLDLRKTGDATFLQGDVLSPEGAKALVDACAEALGGVDILVNNVGGAASEFAQIHKLSDDGWDSGIRRNLYSAFWSIRAAVPYMLDNQWGRIINMSSVQGKLVTMSTISPYVTAKHAIGGLTKAVAAEYGSVGITCNALCPGAVETDTFRNNAKKSAEAAGISVEEFRQRFIDPSATKRLVQVDEVAAAVVFLASDESAPITGVQLSIDGGMAPY